MWICAYVITVVYCSQGETIEVNCRSVIFCCKINDICKSRHKKRLITYILSQVISLPSPLTGDEDIHEL